MRARAWPMAGLGALAALALAAVVVLTANMRLTPAPRTALFALGAGELAVDNDAILQSLAATPGRASTAWGSVAASARKSALADTQMLTQATADEAEAKELASDDQAQLQALYSGTFNTGDSLGLSTGSLGNYDTLQALQSLPKSLGASMHDDHGDLSAVTQTQLNGLTSELQSLSQQKQSITNSLALQRQQTAAKMASDAMYADHVRLNRATATSTSRQMRAAMRAAQMAEQRAREASVIQANQDAIAKLQMQRIAELQGQNQAALAAAASAESQLRAAEAYKRAGTDRKYQDAMAAYTTSLQSSTADDMLTLNRLKVAEEAAAPGPHVISSVWSKPPTGSVLPPIDPNGMGAVDPDGGAVDANGEPWGFMNDAPLRRFDAEPGGLMDPEYKQAAGTSETLKQTGAAATQQLALVPAKSRDKFGLPSQVAATALAARAGASGSNLRAKKAVAKQDPLIMRVMAQADAELKDLSSSSAKARETQLSATMASKTKRLHSAVDATLQQLTQQARKIGINVSPVDKDFASSARPSVAAADAGATTSSAGGNAFLGELKSEKLASAHFTSFPLTSSGEVRTSDLRQSDAMDLDDGAIITNARAPVARMAIPLGAHQDATEDRKEGRSWKSLRHPARATIKDTVVASMRADGSHHPAKAPEMKLVMPKGGASPDVHMPHMH